METSFFRSIFPSFDCSHFEEYDEYTITNRSAHSVRRRRVSRSTGRIHIESGRRSYRPRSFGHDICVQAWLARECLRPLLRVQDGGHGAYHGNASIVCTKDCRRTGEIFHVVEKKPALGTACTQCFPSWTQCALPEDTLLGRAVRRCVVRSRTLPFRSDGHEVSRHQRYPRTRTKDGGHVLWLRREPDREAKGCRVLRTPHQRGVACAHDVGEHARTRYCARISTREGLSASGLRRCAVVPVRAARGTAGGARPSCVRRTLRREERI